MSWVGGALAFLSAALAMWLFLKTRRLGEADELIQKNDLLLVDLRHHLYDVQHDYASINSLFFRVMNEGESDSKVRRQIAFELNSMNLNLPQLSTANDDVPLKQDYSQAVLAQACQVAASKLETKSDEFRQAIERAQGLLTEQKRAVQYQFSQDFGWALIAQVIGMSAIATQAVWG